MDYFLSLKIKTRHGLHGHDGPHGSMQAGARIGVIRYFFKVFKYRLNSKRFSRSASSVTYFVGPAASTLATMVVSSLDDRARLTACTNSSQVVTVAVCGTPAAFAVAARSVPVAVAVGKPPTDSRLSLSKTI